MKDNTGKFAILLTIIASLAVGGFLLWQQASEGWNVPPTIMPFLFFGLAIGIALWSGVPSESVVVIEFPKGNVAFNRKRWLVLAILSSLLALVRIPNTTNEESFGFVVFLWLLSMGAFVWFVRGLEDKNRKRFGMIEWKRPIILTLPILLIVALFLLPLRHRSNSLHPWR